MKEIKDKLASMKSMLKAPKGQYSYGIRVHMKEITSKLASIQSRLKAPKGQFNSFGKYKYRSCEDILEAVKPLTFEQDLVLTLSDEVLEIGGRVYVRSVATVSDGESRISATAFAREDESKKGMDVSQLTGSTSSYARKYALNGLFCIDDTKDADATYRHTIENKPPEPAPGVNDAIAKLEATKTLADLREAFLRLPADLRDHPKVIAAKDTLKQILEPNEQR